MGGVQSLKDDLSIRLSTDEQSAGKMAHETALAAINKLIEHGCVVLRGVFPETCIDALYSSFMSSYGILDAGQMAQRAAMPAPNRVHNVGKARYEIAVPMTGVFGDHGVFANTHLCKLLYPLLGTNMRLNSFTVVGAYPGGGWQHEHRDHDHLFPDVRGMPDLPIFAVNIGVPLLDVDIERGPTAVWPGSHRWAKGVESTRDEAITFSMQRGDCLLTDFRTIHAGSPNVSDRLRPVLYMSYSRTWFFDETNHYNRRSLDMPRAVFEALPKKLHPLLIRARTQSVRADWHKVDDLPTA